MFTTAICNYLYFIRYSCCKKTHRDFFAINRKAKPIRSSINNSYGIFSFAFFVYMEKREIAILLSFCEKKFKKKNPATILKIPTWVLGISNLNFSMAETEVALFL